MLDGHAGSRNGEGGHGPGAEMLSEGNPKVGSQKTPRRSKGDSNPRSLYADGG
jgi:hypothetical protein